MNKTELVDAIASDTGLSKADATRALDSVFKNIGSALKDGKRISLVGFGSFFTRSYDARSGVNPRTGESITISARTVPAFKPGKALKDAVN